MAFTISFTGVANLFRQGEKITIGKLNRLLRLAGVINGTADTSDITDYAVTPAKSSFGAWFYGIDTGTADAHVVTVTPAISGYTEGLVIAYAPVAGPNTGAVTINVSGLGAKTLKTVDGRTLSAGTIRAGQIIEVRYNGTDFVLLSQGANTERHYATSSGSGTAYVVTHAGTTGFATITALKNGVTCTFKAHTASTGAATLAPDGLTAKPLRKGSNIAIASGDITANLLVTATYDETLDVWLISSPLSTDIQVDVQASISGTKKLVIANNAGAAASKVDVTADEIIVKDSSSTPRLLSSVILTIDIGASGANGLDTGVEANDTWYYIWIIYNDQDGTTAGLLSASSSAPTLPTNYTFKALVGAVHNGSIDGTTTPGDFVTFRQVANEVALVPDYIFNNKTGVTSYTVLSGSDLTRYQRMVPAIATHVRGFAGPSISTNAAYAIAVSGSSTGLGGADMSTYIPSPGAVAIDGIYGPTSFSGVPQTTDNKLYWKAGATTSNAYRIAISGFRL